MNLKSNLLMLPPLIAAAWLASGCGSTPGAKSSSSSDSGAKPAATTTAAAPASGKIGPGMNAAGEVTDPRKVESGYGQKVKGLDDWEGEITGKPAPGGKFANLKIGMTASSVIAQLGQPSDQGSYVTGKAFIPFYFGSDKYRYESVYKGQGRLIFASSAGYAFGDMHLIWIIHNANEGTTR